MSTCVSRKLRCPSNTFLQATLDVGSVNFSSFTAACTRGGWGRGTHLDDTEKEDLKANQSQPLMLMYCHKRHGAQMTEAV